MCIKFLVVPWTICRQTDLSRDPSLFTDCALPCNLSGRRSFTQVRPKKKRKEQPVHLLSQEELLAEAAYTEIANLRSLEALQAAEEEVKKKAAVKRGGYSGPCIRLRSKQINGESLVRAAIVYTLASCNVLAC